MKNFKSIFRQGLISSLSMASFLIASLPAASAAELGFEELNKRPEYRRFQQHAESFRTQRFVATNVYVQTAYEHDRVGAIAGAIFLAKNLRPGMDPGDAAKIRAQAIDYSNKVNAMIAASRDPSKAGLPEYYEKFVKPVLLISRDLFKGLFNAELPGLGGVVDVVYADVMKEDEALLRRIEQEKSVDLAADAIQKVINDAEPELDRLHDLRVHSNLAKHIDAFALSQNEMSFGESEQELCRRNSRFCAEANIEKIAEAVAEGRADDKFVIDLLAESFRRNDRARQEILAAQSKIHRAVIGELQKIKDEQLKTPGKVLAGLAERDRLQAIDERQLRIHSIGVHMGIQAAGFILGRKNPAQGRAVMEFGQQIVATKNALDLAGAFLGDQRDPANPAAKSPFEMLSIGAMVSGNLFSMGIKLVGIFANRNPPPTIEKIILDEIRAFRKDFTAFVRKNEAALENLDSRLLEVYQGLQDSLDQLAQRNYEIQKTLNQLENSIGNIQLGLEVRSQNTMEALRVPTFRNIEELRSRCLRGVGVRATDRLSQVEFNDCARLLELQLDKYSRDRMSQAPSAVGQGGQLFMDGFMELLRQPLELALSEVFRAAPVFYQPGSTEDFLGLGFRDNQIPSLRIWNAAADVQTQLFAENLHYVDASRDPINSIRAPIRELENIQRGAQSRAKRLELFPMMMAKLGGAARELQDSFVDAAVDANIRAGANIFTDEITAKLRGDEFTALKVCPGSQLTEMKDQWKATDKNKLVEFESLKHIRVPTLALAALPAEAVEIAKMNLRSHSLCVDSMGWTGRPVVSEKYYTLNGKDQPGHRLRSPYEGLPYYSESFSDHGGSTRHTDQPIYIKRAVSQHFQVTLNYLLGDVPVTLLRFETKVPFPAFTERQRARAILSRHNFIDERKSLGFNRASEVNAIFDSAWSERGFGVAPMITQIPIVNAGQRVQAKQDRRSSFYREVANQVVNRAGKVHQSLQQLDAAFASAKTLLTALFPISTIEDPMVRAELYGGNGSIALYEKQVRPMILKDAMNKDSTAFAKLQTLIAQFQSSIQESPFLGQRPEGTFESFPLVERMNAKLEQLQVDLAKRNPLTLDVASDQLSADVLRLRR